MDRDVRSILEDTSLLAIKLLVVTEDPEIRISRQDFMFIYNLILRRIDTTIKRCHESDRELVVKLKADIEAKFEEASDVIIVYSEEILRSISELIDALLT